jgi:hypothetical protein
MNQFVKFLSKILKLTGLLRSRYFFNKLRGNQDDLTPSIRIPFGHNIDT